MIFMAPGRQDLPAMQTAQKPRLVFITPPIIKPSEPGLSAAAAASWFKNRSMEAEHMDASMGWFRYALRQDRLQQALDNLDSHRSKGFAQACKQAIATHAGMERLRLMDTYRDRQVYTSSVSHLVQALALCSSPFPGFHLRVGDVEVEGRRPQDSADLFEVARQATPFDSYFLEELLPALEAQKATHIALSLTFLNQAFAAFRLAFLLKEHLPHIKRFLGGPLTACWSAVGASFSTPAFQLFNQVFQRSDQEDMQSLAGIFPASLDAPSCVLAPDLPLTEWQHYLTPLPTVPLAFGRGCYWRRCAFCPDYLHDSYSPCAKESIQHWLLKAAERFPSGMMLHLTDSALSPSMADLVASTIREHHLPIQWHGFARMERRFADPTFMEHLREGGCVMLQWGLECASNRLLALMDKGLSAEHAASILRASASKGIRNHIYLLFGLPTETEDDREMTLAFVQREAGSIFDLNASLLNVPRRSPMHENPQHFGITNFSPFGGETDLSLYLDFHCCQTHPRTEARRWVGSRFMKDASVKGILGDLKAPFKENHACFLGRR